MAVDRLRNNTIVILDTNALFMPFQFKVNLDSELKRLLGEYEIIIPSCVYSELRGLKKTEKFGNSAEKLALKKAPPLWYLEFEKELFSDIEPVKEPVEGEEIRISIDDKILQIAKAINGIVVTNDKRFLKQLRANGVKTISLRGKKYLRFNVEE